MEFKFLSIDDLDIAGSTVFLRVDINVPVDPSTRQILDDSRIKAIVETLNSLEEARVVLGSHQSRPGKEDFTSLEEHARVLQRYCIQRVRFVEDVIGPEARRAIRDLRVGEILVLDNLRLCAEENIEDEPEKLKRTLMIQRLAPYFDYYVNDAFAASHRSQASLVAFPELMPSAAGRLMEKELNALKILLRKPERPVTYVIGGAKVEDKVPVIQNILELGKADHMLLGGVTAKVFLCAKGWKAKGKDRAELERLNAYVQKAQQILAKHPERISLPEDFAVTSGHERLEVPIEQLNEDAETLDIGKNTIRKYVEIIKHSQTIVANGPLGIFERESFDTGTRAVLEAMSETKGFTVIGGGHLAGYASILGIERRFSHVSTAGGAMLLMLAGQELPAVRALNIAAERFLRRKR
jgi:phosphoglycerate kinase